MPELYSSNPPSPVPPPATPGPAVPPSVHKKVKTNRDFLPPRKGNSLASFWILPSKKIRFETQEADEEILVILRQHWLTNIPWLLLSLVMFWAPAVLQYFPLLESFPVRFRLFFVVVWYLITLMFVFERFLAWFFNLCLITDERIIDVDFTNLTTRRVADADIDKIQDVTFTNSGAVGTIFNFGNVLVQTAAEVAEFVFEHVPNPAKVANILQKMRTEEKIEALEGRLH